MTREQLEHTARQLRRPAPIGKARQFREREQLEVLQLWQGVRECPDLQGVNFYDWAAELSGHSRVTIWRRLKRAITEPVSE